MNVPAHEQFGPALMIVTRQIDYPAEIRSNGLGSTSRCLWLGNPRTASHALVGDRRSSAEALVRDWARADERASRDGREA